MTSGSEHRWDDLPVRIDLIIILGIKILWLNNIAYDEIIHFQMPIQILMGEYSLLFEFVLTVIRYSFCQILTIQYLKSK